MVYFIGLSDKIVLLPTLVYYTDEKVLALQWLKYSLELKL